MAVAGDWSIGGPNHLRSSDSLLTGVFAAAASGDSIGGPNHFSRSDSFEGGIGGIGVVDVAVVVGVVGAVGLKGLIFLPSAVSHMSGVCFNGRCSWCATKGFVAVRIFVISGLIVGCRASLFVVLVECVWLLCWLVVCICCRGVK